MRATTLYRLSGFNWCQKEISAPLREVVELRNILSAIIKKFESY